MACAVSLRTPLTGHPSLAFARRAHPRRSAVRRSAGPSAKACRSSRVTEPSGPVPGTAARSTPSCLASVRTGGLASGLPATRRRRSRSRSSASASTVPASTRDAGVGDVVLGPRLHPCAAGAWPRSCAGRSRRARTSGRPGPARRSARARRALRQVRPRPRSRPAPRPEARRPASRRSRRRPAGDAAVGVGVDRDDRRADVDRLALRHEELGDDAGVGRRQLDQRLGRLDLDDDVVDLDRVAGLDLPGRRSRPRSGPRRRRGGGSCCTLIVVTHQASERSTASSTRSRSGRNDSSSLLGG